MQITTLLCELRTLTYFNPFSILRHQPLTMIWSSFLAGFMLRTLLLLCKPTTKAHSFRINPTRAIRRFAICSGPFRNLAPNKISRKSSFLVPANLLKTYHSTSTTMSAIVDHVEPEQPVEHFRLDYKVSDYTISDIHLSFDLGETESIVTTRSTVVPQVKSAGLDLVLDGEELELLELSVNGTVVDSSKYTITSSNLTLSASAFPADGTSTFTLGTKVRVHPDKNLALSGLYKSGSSSLLCTQCEAMGFRRITYHLDRPDVLSKYTVRLEADKAKFPILLSNGNVLETGDLPGGEKHYAVWEDPFPKPSYLFALVAGDLGSIHSTYTTTSGRVVKLGIYSDKENANQLDHAMYSIKASMKWDEDTFGLECDLDIYNIVATNDFNMGAMENKGLNIFNSAYTLADPKTATDTNFELILGIIGHEYFHNWSGNRVTVRDWFQLTLKEGLTVFRDQWFTSDLTSHAVKRIEDVRGLRSRQFNEDGGPLAHPIRPESYISMDNFYTSTVYVKGAEVIGLYRTLLGTEGFKKGLKLYFERFDGKAVTCDDFRQAMADANNVDLSQLERWYSQAGTPVVNVTQSYDASAQRFTLTLRQHTPSTPSQDASTKLPQVIPVVVGLLDATSGKEVLPSTVLRFDSAEQQFSFENIAACPVLSILRDFSAPVKLELEQTDEELCLLMAHDTDSFNRWDAGNRFSTKLILQMAELPPEKITQSELPVGYVTAIQSILEAGKTVGDASSVSDPSLLAYALQLPDEATLLNQMKVANIDALHAARGHVKRTLARTLHAHFDAVYTKTAEKLTNEYQFVPAEVGRRRLMNTCLDFLTSLGDASATARAKKQFDMCNNMTDKLAALGCLVSHLGAARDAALEAFHRDAAGAPLVLNKWFAIQAGADHAGLADRVRALKTHPDFVLSNPNSARALLSTFSANLAHFHAADGSGYALVADSIIEIDKLNPQVAARLVTSFSQWRSFDAARQALVEGHLRRILAQEKLSRDTLENVQRCLK